MVQSSQPVTYRQIESMGQGGQGVMEDIERERPERNLNEVDPCEKDVWRSSVRSAMGAASLLSGCG